MFHYMFPKLYVENENGSESEKKKALFINVC